MDRQGGTHREQAAWGASDGLTVGGHGADIFRQAERNRVRMRAIDVEIYQLHEEQSDVFKRTPRHRIDTAGVDNSNGSVVGYVIALIILGIVAVTLFLFNSFVSILIGVFLVLMMLGIVKLLFKSAVKAGQDGADNRRQSTVSDIQGRIQTLSEEKERLRQETDRLLGA